MGDISQTYRIAAEPSEVFAALTEAEKIEQWSEAPAEVSAQEGDEFSLFGARIFGKNLSITQNQKIVQEWKHGDWEAPSTVTFELSEDGNDTVVQLTHLDVPEPALDEITKGWEAFYLGRIREFYAS